MTPDQFKIAKSLMEERRAISSAIKVWETELTAPSRLAYKQGWNSDHCTELPTDHVPLDAFASFVSACLKNMKLRLHEIEAEFSKL